MLDMNHLLELERYMQSGDLAEDFENSPEERRYEILDVLEKLMELGEKADEIASKIIFKDSYLGMLAGVDKDDADDETPQT